MQPPAQLAVIALVALTLLKGSAAVYYGDGPKATHYGELDGSGATDGKSPHVLRFGVICGKADRNGELYVRRINLLFAQCVFLLRALGWVSLSREKENALEKVRAWIRSAPCLHCQPYQKDL